MTTPDGFGACVNVARVRIRESMHEEAEVATLSWIEHKMPMVGHDGVRQDTHVGQLFRFGEQIFKQEIVIFSVKYLHATIRTIDDVVDFSSNIDTGKAGHDGVMLYYAMQFVNQSWLSPFPSSGFFCVNRCAAFWRVV